MEKIDEYIEKEKDKFLEMLFSMIRIPTVSAKSDHKPYMMQGAGHLAEILRNLGAGKAEVYGTEGHPVVYAEKIIDPSYPTVLVYGHYDVQPPEPLELWKTPPFEPTVVNGRIYARGADDDKGQLFMQIFAFHVMNTLGLLTTNVKFLVEGEEETGSGHLPDFCRRHKEELKADFILVSDTTMIAPDIPSVTVGVRGLAYFEVEVTGANRDLHSGLYGGAVTNPVNALALMIGALTDKDGRITIPGFYDDVRTLSAEEREALNASPFDETEYCMNLGIDAVRGEAGYTTLERTGVRPSVDVNGIWGGYTGEGAKTVLPSKAGAKISFRLVPDQDPRRVERIFRDFLQETAPPGVRVSVTLHHSGRPYLTSTLSRGYAAAEKAYLEVFGKKPIPIRGGGSIPVIADFQEILGLESIMMGFGLESDTIHSPNESFAISNFLKGIRTISSFYLHFQKGRQSAQ